MNFQASLNQEAAMKPSFQEGPYGVPDFMTNGLNVVREQTLPMHPLEASEKNFVHNRNRMEFAMLKSVQGIHAPLRLTMERQAAIKIRRLPGMSSSNLMYDVLMGNDDSIGFEDILSSDSEKMMDPHLMMEKSMKF